MKNEVINNEEQVINETNAPVQTQYVDEFGNPIDPSLIDEFGNYIGEPVTQYVDEFGNPIDPSLIDEFGNYIGEPRNPDDNHEQSIIDGQIVTNTLNSLNDINVSAPVESAAAHQMDDKELFSGMVTFDYNNVPITDIVNSIILDVINKGASDIHLDPFDDGIKIRIRIDGELNDYSIVPLYVKKNMITRIKIISGMNITESRIPQDGAIRTELANKTIDLRVSCLPTNMGEKIVIRIMDYSMSAQGIESLDFEESNLEKVKKMLSLPNGIILVTGATGSGKSTTVYSMLQRLNVEGTNLITVEDPIEMNIGGVNQVQAQTEIGLDFATVLRSILRQDPDVIMIGEIRDTETARIAVRASITGHLVLSTIHTNNSLSTIERLTDMDVERYLLGSSLSGIISQKLARRLCEKCKKKRPTNEYEKETFKKALNMDIEEIYEPVGCPHCSRGYRGRIAIHEVLLINQLVRDAITNNVDKNILRNAVYGGENGTKTMLQDGLLKVLDGKTSFAEIIKLIDLEDDLGTNTQLGLDNQMNAVAMQNNASYSGTQNITSTAPININITPEMLSGLNLGKLIQNEDDVDEEIIVKPIKHKKKKKKIVEVDLDDIDDDEDEDEEVIIKKAKKVNIDDENNEIIEEINDNIENIDTDTDDKTEDIEEIELPEEKIDTEIIDIEEDNNENDSNEIIELPEEEDIEEIKETDPVDELIEELKKDQGKKVYNKTVNNIIDQLKEVYNEDNKDKIDDAISLLKENDKLYKNTLNHIEELFPSNEDILEELVTEKDNTKDFDDLLKDINSFEDNEIDIEQFDDDDDFELNDDNLDDIQLLKESLNNNVTPLDLNFDDLSKQLDEIDEVQFDDDDDDFELNDDNLDDLYETNEGINEIDTENIDVLDNLNEYDVDEV